MIVTDERKVKTILNHTLLEMFKNVPIATLFFIYL